MQHKFSQWWKRVWFSHWLTPLWFSYLLTAHIGMSESLQIVPHTHLKHGYLWSGEGYAGHTYIKPDVVEDGDFPLHVVAIGRDVNHFFTEIAREQRPTLSSLNGIRVSYEISTDQDRRTHAINVERSSTLPLYGSHKGTILKVFDNARGNERRKVKLKDMDTGRVYNVLGSAAAACYSAKGWGLFALEQGMDVRFFYSKHKEGDWKPDQLQIVAPNAPLFEPARLSALSPAPSREYVQLLVHAKPSAVLPGRPFVAVFGMHNTGTNILTKMIHQYYEVDCSPRPTGDGMVVLGGLTYWKHMYPDVMQWPTEFRQPLVILLCIRHPAEWIASMARRAYELFPDFKPGGRSSGAWIEDEDITWLLGAQGDLSFRVRWRCTGHDIPRRKWTDAIFLWINYASSYVHLNPGIQGAKVYIVRNEDIILSQQWIHAQLHAIGLRANRDSDDTPDIVLHSKQRPGRDLPELGSMQKRVRRSEFYREDGQRALHREPTRRIAKTLAQHQNLLLHLGYHHCTHIDEELHHV